MLNWLSLALRISGLSVLAEFAWQEAEPACFTTIAIKTCSGRPVRVLGCILKLISTRKIYALPLNSAGSIQNGLTHIGSVPCVATRYFMLSNVTSCHYASLHVIKRHTRSTQVTLCHRKSPHGTLCHRQPHNNTILPTFELHTPHIHWSSSQHLFSLLPTFSGSSSKHLIFLLPTFTGPSSNHLISLLPTFAFHSSPQLAFHLLMYSWYHSLFFTFLRPSSSQLLLSPRPYMGSVSHPTPHSLVLVFARPIS